MLIISPGLAVPTEETMDNYGFQRGFEDPVYILGENPEPGS